MGKKKSVVLMTLITIVILVLCAVVAFPKVTVPGTNGIKEWNPTVLQYDLSGDLEGGYYAYYYPNGVISEVEYEDTIAALEGSELTEYQENYKKHGSLYLSLDEDDCIFVGDEISQGFTDAFNRAVEILGERFAARAKYTGSYYRVSVVDDFSVRVELSATEESKAMTSASYAGQVFSQYANMGAPSFAITTSDGSETVSQLKDDGVTIADLIRSVSAKTQYDASVLKITFTDEGEEMLEEFKNNDSATSLDLKLGDDTVIQITTDVVTDKNTVEMGVQYKEESLYAETLRALINSAMEMEEEGVLINDNEATPFSFRELTTSEIRSYGPVYGDNLVWIYVGILAALIIACVAAIVKMGGFGVTNAYTSVSYVIVVALCYAFISGGVFAVSFGSIFVFLAGLALTNVLHVYIYNAIKAEVALGKTVQSSVKNGYKKTLWTIVDIYAVAVLAGIGLLFSVASLNTIASQIVICAITGAFCNLLWGRFINLMLFSASKDKYKYFRLVREDDGDDE